MKNKKVSKKIGIFARLAAKVFNLAPHEVPRVALAFSLKLCFQIGWTIGWTMMTAILVNRAGIDYLPLLYVINAGLIIVSTIFFSELLHRIPRRWLILGTLISGICMLVGAGTIDASENLKLFFGLTLVAESVFFAQLNILLSLFIEELFSPLESARALPIVESSEYVGGITGGLLILAVLSLPHFVASQLALLWATSLGVMALIFAIFYARKKSLPSLNIHRPETGKKVRFGKLREGSKHIRNIPFLKGLLVVVMLQWSLFTLLNFQYTNAVDQSVSHGEETGHGDEHAIDAAAADHGDPHAVNEADPHDTHAVETHAETAEDIHADPHATENLHATGGADTLAHEHDLTHSLGALHIFFSLMALATQLFLTSRIINRVGIIRTLTLHPLTSFLTFLGLFFRFGFGSAVTAKAAFETTTGVYNAAYHSSFYALRESVREHAKEFMEGFIRPLGVIVGTGVIFLLGKFFSAETGLTDYITGAMLVAAAVMTGLLVWARGKYTHVSKKNLELFGDHPAKFDSVEVLAQPGHVEASEILVKSLVYKRESDRLKIKILETLGRLRNPKTIPEILSCFDDKSKEVKLAAVSSLAQFRDLGEHFFTQSFTRHRVVSALKELFEKEDSKEIRSAVVQVFANMHQAEIVPFLIDTIENAEGSVKADCIYVCGLFHDVSAAYYIEPQLGDSDPYIRANAIAALWQFPHYRLKLTIKLAEMLDGKEKEAEKAAVHLIGEIGAIQEKQRLVGHLEGQDHELRLSAALALAKLNHEKTPEILAEYILHEDEELADFAKKHLRRVPKEMQKKVNKIVHHLLSQQLTGHLHASEISPEKTIEKELLEKLKNLYHRAGAHTEVAKIDALLAGKKFD